MDTLARVGKFLLSYNMPTNMSGYHYLKESIAYVIENECIELNKVMFSYIAEKFHTDGKNVERCIRTLINKVQKKLIEAGLFVCRPSSREVILTFAEYINVGFTRTSAYDILAE